MMAEELQLAPIADLLSPFEAGKFAPLSFLVPLVILISDRIYYVIITCFVWSHPSFAIVNIRGVFIAPLLSDDHWYVAGVNRNDDLVYRLCKGVHFIVSTLSFSPLLPIE